MCIATLLAAAIFAGPACDEPDPARYGWGQAFDTSSAGALSGVWGSGPDDVFIVGGDAEQGQIFHYDGAGWTSMAARMEGVSAGLLVWVFGFGPDDVWAVGRGGAALHYDGVAWTGLDTGTTQDLWGVWGSAPDDLWVVGGSVTGTAPAILHFDGAAFSEVALDPAENDRGAVALFKVWGAGDTVFAVGDLGLVLQWTDSGWKQVSAGAKANDDFVSLWGTAADHMVAVGGRSNGRIATWDGQSWQTVMPEGLVGLNAITLNGPDEAVIGGIYGTTGTYTPSTGEVVLDEPLTATDVHALWNDGQGRVYAVGGVFTEPYSGIALVRTEVD